MSSCRLLLNVWLIRQFLLLAAKLLAENWFLEISTNCIFSLLISAWASTYLKSIPSKKTQTLKDSHIWLSSAKSLKRKKKSNRHRDYLTITSSLLSFLISCLKWKKGERPNLTLIRRHKNTSEVPKFSPSIN